MVVIPDIMGLCLYGPLIDKSGNSIKGLAFCKVGHHGHIHGIVIPIHKHRNWWMPSIIIFMIEAAKGHN